MFLFLIGILYDQPSILDILGYLDKWAVNFVMMIVMLTTMEHANIFLDVKILRQRNMEWSARYAPTTGPSQAA